MHAERASSPERKAVHNRVAVVVASVVIAAIPVAVLLDLIRPVLMERDLIRTLSAARGASEPGMDRVDVAIMAAMTVVVAAVCLLARSRHRSRLIRPAMLVCSVAVPIIAVEIVMQLSARPYVFHPATKTLFSPSPTIMPGVVGPSAFTTNLRGMRAAEWDDEAYKVLCVGGSTTICTYLDDEETWPRRLEKLLNERAPRRRFWVGNVGKSGHDTYHHIELLTRLPEAATVDCVLVLCGVNDLDHAIRVPNDIRVRLAPSRTFAIGGRLDPTEPYVKQTYLYAMAKSLLARTPLIGAMDVEDRRGTIYTRRRQARQAAPQDYPLPPLERHLSEYRKNLERIIQLCRLREVRCVLMTQPTIWRDDLPLDLDALIWSRPIQPSGRAVSVADLARGMAAFNRAMLDVCRTQAVECIDLSSQCPKDTTVFYDDEHFNESGARIVAELIADTVLRTTFGRSASVGR